MLPYFATLLIVVSVVLIRKLQLSQRAYLDINKTDWKLNLLPPLSLIQRLFNIVVGQRGASVLITLIEKRSMKSALANSIEQMEKAEASGSLSPILCNAEARRAMRQRLDDYAADMRASTSLNAFAKVLNYFGSVQLLADHAGLLRLGMEAQDQHVREPVFIASLPRTATTMLHRAMAKDTDAWRAFTRADTMQSLPPIPRSDLAARAALAATVQEKLIVPVSKLYPGWFKCLATMHAVVPEEEDEDSGWYNIGLGMTYVETQLMLHSEHTARGMPFRSSELAEYRYAWLDMVMRVYQKLEPENDKPWLMKDPYHTAYLPQLMAQFPDAKVIFTHRAPRDILPSMAKLFVAVKCVSVVPGAEETTSVEIGQYTLNMATFLLNGLVSYSKSTPMDGNQRVDFLFSELAPNMMDHIERIYETFLGEPPTEEAKAIMQAYMDDNKREKTGNQPRSLQDFSLTEQDVTFEEYTDMFLSKVG